MKNPLLGAGMLVAIVVAAQALVPLKAIAAEDSPSSLGELKKENARLREELAALRERDRLKSEISAVRARVERGDSAGTVAPPRPAEPAVLPHAAQSAYAAVMSSKAPVYKAEPVAARSSWGGFYLGLGIGSRWTQGDASVTSASFNNTPNPNAPGSMDIGHSSFRFSPYFGYNWQLLSNWIAGVEGDWGWADKTTTLAGAAYPSIGLLTSINVFTPQNGGDTFSLKSSWDTSLRARLGYLVRPNILLYGTGGPAWLHVESTSTCSHGSVGGGLPCVTGAPQGQLLTPLNITDESTKLGWTLGGGIEGMFGSNWIARAEYRYASFGTISNIDNRSTTPSGTAVFGAPVVSTVAYDLRLATQTVTFGLSYKFGSNGMVTTRY